jgi:hypothetical protein
VRDARQSLAEGLVGSSYQVLLHACQTEALRGPDGRVCRARQDSLQEERDRVRSWLLLNERGSKLVLSRRACLLSLQLRFLRYYAPRKC